jgi:hypothetical protein
MSAYAATARIEHVTPRLVIDREPGAEDWGWGVPAAQVEPTEVDLGPLGGIDPLADRITAVRERWSQLTFYLFDAEGWR